MSDITPREFAFHLGLVPGATPASRRGPQKNQDVLEDLSMQIMSLPLEETRSFWAEFNALYLPSCWDLFKPGSALDLQFKNNISSSYGLWVVFSEWMGSNDSDPSFLRFFRERPDEAAALFFLDTDRMSSVLKWRLDNADTPRFKAQWAGDTDIPLIIGGFDFAIRLYRDFLPSLSITPNVGLETRERLRLLLPRARTFFATFKPGNERIFQNTWIWMEELVMCGEIGLMKWREVRSLGGWQRTLSWWDCERKQEGTCVDVEKGEEMKACGGCLAVRYCCPAHQKADWKKHKLVCFKPSW